MTLSRLYRPHPHDYKTGDMLKTEAQIHCQDSYVLFIITQLSIVF